MKKYTLVFAATFLLVTTTFSLSFPRPEKIPAPERKDMEFKEIIMNKYSLVGKVIETEVDHSHSFKSVQRGLYSSSLHRHPGGHVDDPQLLVYFPEKGKEIAEGLNKAGSGSRTTLYLYIVSENEIYVVGTDYKKRKKKYEW